jgi:hypothetical protein
MLCAFNSSFSLFCVFLLLCNWRNVKLKNIGISESLHKQVKVLATQNDQTIQDFCEDAIKEKVERLSPKKES